MVLSSLALFFSVPSLPLNLFLLSFASSLPPPTTHFSPGRRHRDRPHRRHPRPRRPQPRGRRRRGAPGDQHLGRQVPPRQPVQRQAFVWEHVLGSQRRRGALQLLRIRHAAAQEEARPRGEGARRRRQAAGSRALREFFFWRKKRGRRVMIFFSVVFQKKN